MFISIDDLKFNVYYRANELSDKIPVLFLHGFTGSIADWKFIGNKLDPNYNAILIDLLGHGLSSSPSKSEFYSPESQVIILKKVLKVIGIEKVVIIGYSMGGRLALNFAWKYPENVIALVLESTSFGLKTEEEKNLRLKADSKLAEKIESLSMEKFIDFWLNLPLFHSITKMPEHNVIELKYRKIQSNNKIGLANSLRAFSTGAMEDFRITMKNLNKPILIIAGELDEKFSLDSIEANSVIRNSVLEIVKNCGHNVHYENPTEFLKLVNKFLSNIRELK